MSDPMRRGRKFTLPLAAAALVAVIVAASAFAATTNATAKSGLRSEARDEKPRNGSLVWWRTLLAMTTSNTALRNGGRNKFI